MDKNNVKNKLGLFALILGLIGCGSDSVDQAVEALPPLCKRSPWLVAYLEKGYEKSCKEISEEDLKLVRMFRVFAFRFPDREEGFIKVISDDFRGFPTLRKIIIEDGVGEISDELFRYVPELLALDFSGRGFYGKIHKDLFNNLRLLNTVSLSKTSMEGTLHPNLFIGLGYLKSLTIEASNLKGTLSSGLFRNSDILARINLSRNQIEGSIPPGLFANHKLLVELDLSWNKLTGEIPPDFLKDAPIERLDLTGNKITGPIPDHLKDKVVLSN